MAYPIYAGPLESTGADPRKHMDFEVSYEWPETHACSACGMVDRLVYVTKHHHEGPGNEEGWMYSRCPEHQSRYEKKVAA